MNGDDMSYSKICKTMNLPKQESSTTDVIYDEKKEKRYLLERRWGKEGKVLCGFMMNPSNASHLNSDQTVDQLVNYAEKNDYVALIIVNAVSFIEPQSRKLKNSTIHSADPTNWSFIDEVFKKSDRIIFATGVKGQQALYKFIDSGDNQVIRILRTYREKFYCYDLKLSPKQKNFYYTPHLRPQYNKKAYIDEVPKPISTFPNYKKIFRE